MDHTINAAHVESIDRWDSGGGIELDIVELKGGPTLVIACDTIAVYRTADDHQVELEDETYSGRHRAITLLRETGKPLEFAGSR